MFRIRIHMFLGLPDPDPLVRGMDPRIRIHTKMSWIRNTTTKCHGSGTLLFWVIFALLDPDPIRIRMRSTHLEADGDVLPAAE
jgi:hypothetical protein